ITTFRRRCRIFQRRPKKDKLCAIFYERRRSRGLPDRLAREPSRRPTAGARYYKHIRKLAVFCGQNGRKVQGQL
ncbi:hypothetical protein SERLA73DRAFT_164575, partial [Serpula lacrymans var. lacrymans S7.3]